MPEKIFIAENVTKRYRKRFVLAGIHMEIKRGDIYGFVGGNGAGKTTLMRILTGMTRQTGGRIELFGKGEAKDLCVQRGRIGAMIEAPALYPEMTAKDNLEVIRLQHAIEGKECIGEALEAVGLDAAESKRVKDFSLGMKQRLGLAMALLGNREFLVLDEPVNGLDPEGIAAFRDLIKGLNRERGTTILISSHLLGELDQLATCYGFIHKGKMLEQITAKNLQEKCRTCLDIYIDDAQKAAMVLSEKFPKCGTKIITKHKIHLYGFSGNTGEVAKALISESLNVKEMKMETTGLENYYMTLMKSTGGEK